MPVLLQGFHSLDTTISGRVRVDNDQIVSARQSAFGRLISVITGERQTQNRAVYEAFRNALSKEYGDVGTNALSSLKLKDGSKLLAENVRQVLKLADIAKTQYGAMGIACNEGTRFGSCDDSALCNTFVAPTDEVRCDPTAPGVLVDYRAEDGSLFHGRFKEELAEVSEGAVAGTGIPTTHPKFGVRSIACDRLNRELGLRVIASAEFGFHAERLGVVEARRPGCPLRMKDHEFEISSACEKKNLQAIAKACIGKETKPMALQEIAKQYGLKALRYEEGRLMARADVSIGMDYYDKVLLKEVNDLQWFDALCGRVGRGSGDYLVQFSAEGKAMRVTGVNNGLSFGSKLRDPNAFLGASGGVSESCALPEVIGGETARAFGNATKDDLEDALAGLLTKEEIAACQDRLSVIQARIRNLDAGARILSDVQRKESREEYLRFNGDADYYVSPAGWESASAAVEKYVNSKTNSYVARDREVRAGEVNISLRDVNWACC